MSPISDDKRNEIISLIREGLSSEQIAVKTGVPRQSAAAVKAHMTMGTYPQDSIAVTPKKVSEEDLDLSQAIQEVISLQPKWSSQNSPEMERRGKLIRKRIPALLAPLCSENGLKVEGGDGAGRKNRVPWVRLYDPIFSPKPTEGWYVALLFAADASAVFIALGQGIATAVKGGFVQKDAVEVEARTRDARLKLQNAEVSTEGLLEHIQLNDDGNLGKGYEKGNAYAIKYDAGKIPDSPIIKTDISRLLPLLDVLSAAPPVDVTVPPVKQTGKQKKESFAMNLILYGPPGTGKTYQSIERAVKFIDPDFMGEDHVAYKRKFDEMVHQGRIEFITFHQSYSYEDFVEGIRPVVDDDGEGNVRYECRAGVFKRLAINALFDCLEMTEAAKQLVPFDVLWKTLLSKIESEPAAKYPGLTDKTSYRLSVTERGNIEGNNVVSDKNFLCTRKVLAEVFDAKRGQDSVTTAEVIEVVVRGCHSQFVAAVFNELRRIEKSQFRGNVQQPRPTIHAEEEKAEVVQRFLAEDENSGYQLKPESRWNQYVLVIDEINRGNIGKILGELITLIEEDKRLRKRDQQNSLVVTLPYSGEKFAVPGNLCLLATMNTADKSIALVDVALRRRFEFEELRVDLSVCGKLTDNMRRALEQLNRRIILRKDRDHQIGHAYFVSVTDEPSFNQRFRKQIIPLLQEYFYNDWEGLRYVLGENSNSNGKFISKVNGADVREARTKWQWFFDASDDGLNCLQTLCGNYEIV